jgi:hypothetical protein
MKNFLNGFNWKNFLQRTALFFLVFVVIRILVDWFEGNFSFNNISQQDFIRYLILGLILGLLDSDTWSKTKGMGTKEEPLQFRNFRAALFHYIGLAFFIALLCGVIFAALLLLVWGISRITGAEVKGSFTEAWKTYLLIIAVIGICFSLYDAIRNYMRLKRLKTTGKD